MCMMVRQIGRVPSNHAGWWVLEEPVTGNQKTLLSEYNFRVRGIEGDKWEHVVRGFAHYVSHRSNGYQIIAHLDVDEEGVMSNCVVYDKR